MPYSIRLPQIPELNHVIPTTSDQLVVVSWMEASGENPRHVTVVPVSIFTEKLLIHRDFVQGMRIIEFWSNHLKASLLRDLHKARALSYS